MGGKIFLIQTYAYALCVVLRILSNKWTPITNQPQLLQPTNLKMLNSQQETYFIEMSQTVKKVHVEVHAGKPDVTGKGLIARLFAFLHQQPISLP